MPNGPRGEKCPADAIGLAVVIGNIATGEIVDDADATHGTAAQFGGLGGRDIGSAMVAGRSDR
jgi:hypothetical protein